MPTFRVRISEGNTLLFALVGAALLDTAGLVAAMELKVTDRSEVVLGVFFGALVIATIALFQTFSVWSDITVDETGVRRTTAGQQDWVQPWGNIRKVLWLQFSAGHVLEIDLHQGESVKWTQSSWMAGHAQFGLCAAEIERRAKQNQETAA